MLRRSKLPKLHRHRPLLHLKDVPQRSRSLPVDLEALFDNFRGLARVVNDCAFAEVIVFAEPVQTSHLGRFSNTALFDEHMLQELQALPSFASSLYPEPSGLAKRLAMARSLVSTPLLRDPSEAMGLFIVGDGTANRLSRSHFRAIEAIARCVASHYELHGLAMEDALTGALSRRGFELCAEIEIGRFVRYDRPASMVLFDLDHFKQLNDRFGHAVGDEVLRKVSAICAETKRVQDHFARIGGEEFALILPETALPQAVTMAERLRKSIELIDASPEGPFKVTASFGVKALDFHTSELPAWLRDCDRALYRAKSNGRNQVQTG